MTGRERWIKLFKDEKIDRVLINPFIWINSVYELFKHKPKNFNDLEYKLEKIYKFIENKCKEILD